MRKALGMILLAGLFLLLLSALVVTPEDALPMDPVPPLRDVQAVFVPAAPLAQTAQAASETPVFHLQALRLMAACLAAAALMALGKHDSNGRIVRHARYENSVYQVFRPEVAGG